MNAHRMNNRWLQQGIIGAMVSASLLASSACSTLKSNTSQIRLNAYERGCVMRGTEKGLSEVKAQQLCRCHIEKATQDSSAEKFLARVEAISAYQKNPVQKPDVTLVESMEKLKASFIDCKKQLGL